MKHLTVRVAGYYSNPPARRSMEMHGCPYTVACDTAAEISRDPACRVAVVEDSHGFQLAEYRGGRLA